MSTTAQPPKPKRRWYQFSLRSLLIVITVATVTFGGWLQFRRHRARNNQERVAAVEKAVTRFDNLGGWVTSEYEDLRLQTWLEEHFDDPGPSDDPVRILHVKVVNLVLPNVTDADVKHLNTLKQFASLSLNGNNLAQVDLGSLKELASRAKMNRDRVEAVHKNVVTAIEKSGGRVWSLYDESRSPTWLEMLLDDPGPSDDPIRTLHVKIVNLVLPNITNADVERLNLLKHFGSLSINGENITQVDLGDLKELADGARANRKRVPAVDKNVVTKIEKLGGRVEALYDELRSPTWLEMLLDDPGPSDDPVRTPHVKVVDLVLPNITDANVEFLNSLKRVGPLSLNGTNVTQVELGDLKEQATRARRNRDRLAAVEKTVAETEKLHAIVMSEYVERRSPTWLEALLADPGDADDPVRTLTVTGVDFYFAEITDTGLKHLKKLSGIEELYIDGEHVTDAGLEHLKGLTSLKTLYLYNPRVTDAGLGHLKGLTNLENLYLARTKVTDQGIEMLKRSLPNCKITR